VGVSLALVATSQSNGICGMSASSAGCLSDTQAPCDGPARGEWRPPADVPEPAAPEEVPAGQPDEPSAPPPPEAPPGPSEVPSPPPHED
jgi:hypothetical protein